MDAEQERREFLDAVRNLAGLIENTADPAKIADYIDELKRLQAKLSGFLPYAWDFCCRAALHVAHSSNLARLGNITVWSIWDVEVIGSAMT